MSRILIIVDSCLLVAELDNNAIIVLLLNFKCLAFTLNDNTTFFYCPRDKHYIDSEQFRKHK